MRASEIFFLPQKCSKRRFLLLLMKKREILAIGQNFLCLRCLLCSGLVQPPTRFGWRTFFSFFVPFSLYFLSPHFFRLRNKNMISREVSKNCSFKNNLGYEIYSRKVSMKHWCLSLNLYGNWSHAQKLLLLKKAVFLYGYSKLKI